MKTKTDIRTQAMKRPQLADRLAISVKELCRACSISKSTAHKWINDQKVQATRVNGRTLVLVDSVRSLLGIEPPS